MWTALSIIAECENEPASKGFYLFIFKARSLQWGKKKKKKTFVPPAVQCCIDCSKDLSRFGSWKKNNFFIWINKAVSLSYLIDWSCQSKFTLHVYMAATAFVMLHLFLSVLFVYPNLTAARVFDNVLKDV